MSTKKKILSYCLLAIYLLAGVQSIGATLPHEQLHHHHKDFDAVHHEHAFHIGIFHFLGHFMEKIGQQQDSTDDYLQPAIVLPSKNVNDEKNMVSFGHAVIISNTVEGGVNINDPPDDHLTLPFSQLSILSSRPLRAPPSC